MAKMSCKCCSSGTSCPFTVVSKHWTPWQAGLAKSRQLVQNWHVGWHEPLTKAGYIDITKTTSIPESLCPNLFRPLNFLLQSSQFSNWAHLHRDVEDCCIGILDVSWLGTSWEWSGKHMQAPGYTVTDQITNLFECIKTIYQYYTLIPWALWFANYSHDANRKEWTNQFCAVINLDLCLFPSTFFFGNRVLDLTKILERQQAQAKSHDW